MNAQTKLDTADAAPAGCSLLRYSHWNGTEYVEMERWFYDVPPAPHPKIVAMVEAAKARHASRADEIANRMAEVEAQFQPFPRPVVTVDVTKGV